MVCTYHVEFYTSLENTFSITLPRKATMDIYLIGKYERVCLRSEADLIDALTQWLDQCTQGNRIKTRSGVRQQRANFLEDARGLYKSIIYGENCCDCLVFTETTKLWLARQECSDVSCP